MPIDPMYVEMGLASLQNMDHDEKVRELHPLRALAVELKAELPNLVPNQDPLSAGFLLGILTARTIIETTTAAQDAGIKI